MDPLAQPAGIAADDADGADDFSTPRVQTAAAPAATPGATPQFATPQGDSWWSGDGTWKSVAEDGEELIYTINTLPSGSLTITRADGDETVEEGTAVINGSAIDAHVFGGDYSAELSDDGKKLTWDDGDVWGKAGPRRRKLTVRLPSKQPCRRPHTRARHAPPPMLTISLLVATPPI